MYPVKQIAFIKGIRNYFIALRKNCECDCFCYITKNRRFDTSSKGKLTMTINESYTDSLNVYNLCV